MNILERLEKFNVFSVDIIKDNTALEFIEECDLSYSCVLSKAEVGELISELTELYNQMK